MTNQEFFETAALYTRVDIDNFSPPDSISRMCDDPECQRETTWQKTAVAEHKLPGKELSSISHAAYVCGLCKRNSVVFFYQLIGWVEDKASTLNQYGKHRWHHTGASKIGQFPAPTVTISPELMKQLGATGPHYRNALITRQHGLGIAAMAYMRRVVDEKTDVLIDIMAELARTHQVSENEVTALLEAKAEQRYDQKLEKAADLIPQSLRPGSVNPLGQLYKQTSTGLHGKSDAECVAIFDDLKADFEYIFRNLHNEVQERKAFVKRMTTRAGKS